MNILKLANWLNVMVWLHDDIKSFHRGYIEDIGVDQNNNFDENLEVGKTFPHLLLLPAEGRWDLKDAGKDRVTLEIRLFNLYSVDNTGEDDGDTKGEKWYDLKRWLYQILRELRKGNYGSGARQFSIGEVEWFEDFDVAANKLVYIGARFTVPINLACDDFVFNYASLPTHLKLPIAGDEDYEERTA